MLFEENKTCPVCGKYVSLLKNRYDVLMVIGPTRYHEECYDSLEKKPSGMVYKYTVEFVKPHDDTKGDKYGR